MGKISTDLNNKINSSKQVIGAFKIETQKKLDDFTDIPPQSSGAQDDKIKIL